MTADKERKSNRRGRGNNIANRRTDLDGTGSQGHHEIRKEYDSDDSEYGNFNPNLYAHQRQISEQVMSPNQINRNESRMKLTD